MDGIYHATIVCARLVTFANDWLKHGTPDAESRAWAEDLASHTRDRFAGGARVVREDGILSNEAARYLDNATDRVAECAA